MRNPRERFMQAERDKQWTPLALLPWPTSLLSSFIYWSSGHSPRSCHGSWDSKRRSSDASELHPLTCPFNVSCRLSRTWTPKLLLLVPRPVGRRLICKSSSCHVSKAASSSILFSQWRRLLLDNLYHIKVIHPPLILWELHLFCLCSCIPNGEKNHMRVQLH